MPATPVPTPVPVAQPPAATPIPVHDDEAAPVTSKAVDGALGQTLTIDGYSVRAVRVYPPVDGECPTSDPDAAQFYEVTLTYTGPLFDVRLGLASDISSSCIAQQGEASVQYPSGVPRVVTLRFSEESPPRLPFRVTVLATNAPNPLIFRFH